jgi:Ca2+-binding EF-hand superfamily protein
MKKRIWFAAIALLPCMAAAEAADKPKQGAEQASGMSAEDFRHIDTNHDDGISREEAEKAGARVLVNNFKAIDTNKNGKLSLQEINDFLRAQREEALRRVREADEKDFQQVDANHDGSISMEEAEKAPAPLLANNFAAIDTDKNGKLSQQEVIAFLQAQREQMVRRILAADEEAFRRIDANHDGYISREEATKAPAPLLAANFDAIDINKDGKLSPQEAGAFWQMRRRGIARLMAADKNHDGALSKEEVKDFPGLAADFDKIDADHNGKITMQEINSYYQSASAGQKPAATGATAEKKVKAEK